MKISPFSKTFDRSGFHCGERLLDAYLRHQAGQDIRANVAQCFILHEAGSKEIVGYYTLSSFSVWVEDLPFEQQKKLPRYPQIPVILLGRLAVAKHKQGHGIGKLLVVDALNRAENAGKDIGTFAVVVDPLNASASHFYSKFGFRHFSSTGDRMFLTMKEIRANR